MKNRIITKKLQNYSFVVLIFIIICIGLSFSGCGINQEKDTSLPQKDTETKEQVETKPESSRGEEIVEPMPENIIWGEEVTGYVNEWTSPPGTVDFSPQLKKALEQNPNEYIAIEVHAYNWVGNSATNGYATAIDSSIAEYVDLLSDDKKVMALLQKYNDAYQKSEDKLAELINEKGYSAKKAYMDYEYVKLLGKLSDCWADFLNHISDYDYVCKKQKEQSIRRLEALGLRYYSGIDGYYTSPIIYIGKAEDIADIANNIHQYESYCIGLAYNAK